MTFETINPATGLTLKTFHKLSDNEVIEHLEKAHQTQLDWTKSTIDERKRFLHQLAKNLLADVPRLSTLITEEMGKPIVQARQEIEKCALICEYYASHLDDFLAHKKPSPDNPNYFQLCPSGIVFAIMPWNFPFWQVFRAAIPNLALGNGFLLSHAPNVLGSAKNIQSILQKSGLPEGLMQHLIIDYDQVANIIQYPYISGVTLTGSQKTGKHIATLAGNALKKVVLELGGNDPYIILNDADLDLAANTLVSGRFMNAGQVCISPKRIIATSGIYEAFQEKVMALVKSYQTGNPMNEHCMMGPMARNDLRQNLHQQIKQSIEKGAHCLVGGYIEDKPGYYYAPTLLSNVTPGMPAFDDELFGPVVSLIHAKDEHEAIILANQSCYGLGGGIFTKDTQKAELIIANQLNVGLGKINGMVRSDPKLPFGGVKGSGFGRECGLQGLQEFANIKTIIV